MKVETVEKGHKWSLVDEDGKVWETYHNAYGKQTPRKRRIVIRDENAPEIEEGV